jgi:tetratricopeptide (TPR) repeat protein
MRPARFLFIALVSTWVAARLTAADSGTAAEADAASGEAAPEKVPVAETMSAREFRLVREREAAIWDRLRRAGDDPEAAKRAEADFRDVTTAYENVLRMSPENAEAWAAYGMLLSRTGNREQATMAFLKANRLDASMPLVKNQLGNYLFEDGDYRAALGYYLAAVELAPGEALYHYHLGTLLREYREFFIDDGMFERPVLDAKMHEAFRLASRLEPDNWGFAYRFAESFYDLESPDWVAALVVWDRLEKRTPPGPEADAIRLHRANVLIRLDCPEDARALVETVTDPALAETRNELLERLEKAAKPAVP